MSNDAIGILGGLAFVIWIATASILSEMRKAARQRQAVLDQLDRIASQQGRSHILVETIAGSLRHRSDRSGL